jgi:hypothetical protein
MKAKIYQPAKTATQSGRGKTQAWVLEYELQTSRTPEPLMGWVASGDTLNQVRLKFKTLDEAVEFAREKGLEYTVSHPHERRVKPRNYADNFRYIPTESL